jgi:hypothetical protein
MKTKSPMRLTMDKVVVRVVQIPMRRPIVARLGEFKSFPYILTDVHTGEGVIRHTNLEPYLVAVVAGAADCYMPVGTDRRPHGLAQLRGDCRRSHACRCRRISIRSFPLI